MHAESINGTDREQKLNSIVLSWLEALDRGEAPNREGLLAQHPEFTVELGKFLDDHMHVDRRAAPLRFIGLHGAKVSVDQMLGSAAGTPLGDFRIIREVGRGGMGVVYEAEQLSLGRRVALKVLSFAATMDARQLQRFQNEARAAASLEHPHIVPVYGVGCERGVHYYAMKLINGRSLAEILAAVQTKSSPVAPGAAASHETAPVAVAKTEPALFDRAHFHRVAEWGVQAAEALEFAHSLGIVHRDVKPANLLIDEQRQLWVTDFGLARTAADSGLTMTGDMVGTLRYMSPEQALANRGLMDRRTDVYSLGATLYELCTGRPAVAGKNRQEILKGLADEGPPPRATAAPAELETIVQKAMAKDPADRYATARELADDLGRYLDDKPIRAKRPTPAQRLWKWGQRHRQVVRAAAFFLGAAIIGLAVSVFLIWQEKERTREALMEALANRRRAESQRQRAETNFREAYWTLEDLLVAFDTEGDAHSTSIAELKQWQTGAALRFLAPFCDDESDEPDRRLQKGAALVHTGRVYQVLGQREKAQEAFRRAVAVFARLVQDFPEETTYSREMAMALSILATDLFLAGNIAEANSQYRQALGILREAIQKCPADVEARLKLAHFQCVWLDSNLYDPPAALEMAQMAVKDAPDDPCSLVILGIAQCRMEQWRAAIGTFEDAFRKSRSFNRNCETTQGLFFLAMAQTRCGLHQEATESYQKAVRRMADSPVRRSHALTRATRAEAAAVLGIAEPARPK